MTVVGVDVWSLWADTEVTAVDVRGSLQRNVHDVMVNVYG